MINYSQLYPWINNTDITIPELIFLDNVRRNIAGPKLAGGFDPIEIDPRKAAELNARLRVNEMKPKGPLPMETDEFLRQRQIDEMLKGE